MRYRVRNQYGEVGFETYVDLERAYLQGLVESDDEVLEEGSPGWRKAGAMPLLVRARKAKHTVPLGDQVLGVFVAVLLAGLALCLLFMGHWAWAILVVLVLSALLSRVTYNAFKTK